MQYSIEQWVLWVAVAVVQIGVVMRMALSGAWRRWLSLFLFLLVLTIKDILRIANVLTMQNLWADFYVYWTASLIAELFEVWIIIQIAQTMLGISTWARRIISRGVVLMAVITSITSIALSARLSHFTSQSFCMTVDRLSNAVALAWAFVLFVVIVFSDRTSEWSAGARGVAFGITLELTADSYLGWLRINSRLAHLDSIKSALFLVSLYAWSRSTGSWRTDETLPAKTLASILSTAQNLQKVLRLFRGSPA